MAMLATVATFGFADFDPPEILQLYHRLGCRVAQFYRNESNPPDEADVIRICEDAGVPLDSIHGVFGGAHDPSSPDAAVRRNSIETYRREGELSLRLGGPKVVVHPAPLLSTPPQNRTDDAPRRDALRRSMTELADIGRTLGVVYLIENLPPTSLYGHDPVALAALICEVRSPNLRMCFDLGHAHLTGGVDQLRACADVVDYLHVHDNDQQADLHLMPGDGNIIWPGVRRALIDTGLTVSAMLEVFYDRKALEQRIAAGLASHLAEWLDVQASQVASRSAS